MKKLLFLMLAIVLIATPIGCARPAVADEVKSDKPRQTPAVNTTNMEQLVEGNSQFAFNLYQELKKKDGNMFYSPYSMSIALAMTYGGAKGQTATEMADTMRYLLDQSNLHQAFNSLDLELKKRGEGAQGKDDEGFRLNVVNAIWGQRDYKFLESYLDLLAENYGAGLRVLDFINEPDQSTDTINQWVSDQTEGRIKDLIPKGAINDLTRLVLTNAIYFNAAWEYQFKKESTADGVFQLADGSNVSVPMMHQTQTLGYAKGDNYLAVELPYDEKELSMVILTNPDGTFSDFESTLSAGAVKEMIDGIENQRVELTMPKFEFDSEFSMKDTLKAMGMQIAFTESADFTGMSVQSDLHIDAVIHKAFVSVDENGTEAAAATGVIVGTTSAPPEPVVVTLDQPFVFLIRDIQTGAILFIGRVMDPTK